MKKSEKWMSCAVLGALGIVALCLLCIVGAIAVPLKWWSSGGAAGIAKEFLMKNAVVAGKLGTVKGFGSFPSGSERTINGIGTARLTFSVSGSLGQGLAEVGLSKKPGKAWIVDWAVLIVKGEKFILEGNPPTDTPGAPLAPNSSEPSHEQDPAPMDT